MAEAIKLNHPAISSEWAMQEYAASREAERRALIEQVNLESGMTVVDIQAAGGFLSDGVYEYLDGHVHCICVEPVTELGRRINSRFQVVDDQIDNLLSIDTESVDVVLGLAGLHHSPSMDKTISESFRVLKNNGQFAVCDVIKGSAVAHWLNEFVDQHNPDGHEGQFLVQGEASERMRKAGFRKVQETVVNVPWVFDSVSDIARFFMGLFNLQITPAEVEQAIPEYLDIVYDGARVLVNWELIYARGLK